MYRMWGRVLAHQGLAVAMIDFRNCLTPSSAPEIEPFPAGLNDCVAGVRWTVDHAVELGIDPDRVIVAGESGGGNLTLAIGMRLLRDGDMGLVRGLYALCPYIAGRWPQERFPSSIENEGILLNLPHNRGASPTASSSSTPGIPWRGRRSPPTTMCAACRRDSSAS